MTWDWAFAVEILPRLLQGLVITVQATAMASAVALVVGLVIAVGRRARTRALAWPLRGFTEFIRRTPLLVQLYFIFFVLPDFGITLSPLTAGVIGLGLHYSAYTAEVYRAGIEGVPKGQWEASKALNMGARHTWTHIVLPQAVPPIIPPLGNYVLAMFKESALLSAITVIEVMNAARIISNQTYRYLEPMTLVGVLFLLVSLPAAFGLRRLEARLTGR